MARAPIRCVLLVALLTLAGEVRAQSGFTGTFITHNFADAPNLIDLQANGSRVMGTISRSQQVFPIWDGTISGNVVTFKSGGGDRITTYTGRLNGDEIDFTRTVQIVRAAGGAGIFGSGGPMEFVATRDLANGLAIPRALFGNWRLDPKRSTFDPGPTPPEPMVFDHRSFVSMPGGRVGLNNVTVGEFGDPAFNIMVMRADGRDYPVHSDVSMGEQLMDRTPALGFRVLRVVNERTFELTNKNAAGVITATRQLTVSADGSTLTDVTTVLDAQGKKTATNTAVYERLSPAGRPPTN
jgi:hypothetical protein